MQGRSTCSCCKLCSSKLFTVVAVALCKTTRMRHQTSSVHTQPAHTTTHIYTHCLKLKQTEASVQQAPEETILPPDLLAPKAVIQMLQNYAQMLQNYTQMLQNYTQMLQTYTQMLQTDSSLNSKPCVCARPLLATLQLTRTICSRPRGLHLQSRGHLEAATRHQLVPSAAAVLCA